MVGLLLLTASLVIALIGIITEHGSTGPRWLKKRMTGVTHLGWILIILALLVGGLGLYKEVAESRASAAQHEALRGELVEVKSAAIAAHAEAERLGAHSNELQRTINRLESRLHVRDKAESTLIENVRLGTKDLEFLREYFRRNPGEAANRFNAYYKRLDSALLEFQQKRR